MMDTLPLFLLSPVLFAAAYFDLRYLRIPNWLVLTAIGLFALTLPAIGWQEAGFRILVSVFVLMLGFTLFVLNLFGGGDVKMMAALLLFVPSGSYTEFAFGFSAAMVIGILGVSVIRSMPVLAGSTWAFARQTKSFPMGVSIAMCGLSHPFVLIGTSAV